MFSEKINPADFNIFVRATTSEARLFAMAMEQAREDMRISDGAYTLAVATLAAFIKRDAPILYKAAEEVVEKHMGKK